MTNTFMRILPGKGTSVEVEASNLVEANAFTILNLINSILQRMIRMLRRVCGNVHPAKKKSIAILCMK